MAETIDDSLKTFAIKSSKDTSRLKALTKIVDQVANIATESCLLSTTQIELRWPQSSVFDPENMADSNISIEDMQHALHEIPIGGFIFPMVLKHQFNEDGTRTIGILRKSTPFVLPEVSPEKMDNHPIQESSSVDITDSFNMTGSPDAHVDEVRSPSLKVKVATKSNDVPVTLGLHTDVEENLVDLEELPKNPPGLRNSSKYLPHFCILPAFYMCSGQGKGKEKKLYIANTQVSCS